MKNDNTTPLSAEEYDRKISNTIPYYAEFCSQIFDMIASMDFKKMKWLDLGCGTGTLEEKAVAVFPEAGFAQVHVFWYSYMQMGIYGIK